MATRGRKPIGFKREDLGKMVKRNYYIDQRYAKALTVLSALTGKELSLLVNEALSDLVTKHQPHTDIDLLRLKAIQ